MYKQDFALNSQQDFVCRKTEASKLPTNTYKQKYSYKHIRTSTNLHAYNIYMLIVVELLAPIQPFIKWTGS